MDQQLLPRTNKVFDHPPGVSMPGDLHLEELHNEMVIVCHFTVDLWNHDEIAVPGTSVLIHVPRFVKEIHFFGNHRQDLDDCVERIMW